ncbi:MAG: SDR family oxidoreductase [Clostridiales bacterium]|nr:SDR family oxidoreductase [Clostridiales bacterium]
MKKSWLNHKTIVITGASSGIGQELSRIFIEKHNCKIIGVGRNQQKMEEFKTSLSAKNVNFEYRLFDVSSEENWKNFTNEFAKQKVDIIINNAGMLPPFASVEKLSTILSKDNFIGQEFQKVMDTNFMSVVYGTHYMMPIIEKSETPAIINVASSAGLCALPGTSLYSASKAAVKNFTEALSCEKKYYVGLVCPGFTKTNIFRNQTHSSKNKLIDFISTDLTKMANKIYKKIKRKKKRVVVGFDAKMMDKFYRIFPKASLKLFSSVLKKANIELFKDVFSE